MPARSKPPADRERLGPEDWVGVALEAISERGVPYVSVERLAAELGATKGSFYWHFKDRPALIQAALDRWEELHTDRIIEALSVVSDPRERFRRLLASAFDDNPGSRIDATLLANGDDPIVRAALASVARKRLSFVEGIFRELGGKRWRDRALLAFSAYVGIAQLRRTSPELVASGAEARPYIANVTSWLLGDGGPG